MGIAILYPVFAQIVLTMVVMVGMGLARRDAIASGEVRYSDVAVDSSRWPERARKWANCYSNQFELPVVFYVLCLIALMTRNADVIMVGLAWLFVASRVAHAYVHTGSNVVLRRGGVFLIGFIVVVLMTAILLFRLAFAGA